jgi:hypothetical protein
MKIKKTGIPVYVTCSRQSARTFIKLYAGIKATSYWFHQTLTFGTPKPDLPLAHVRLKALLDRLEKTQPDMACFWVREQEKETGYHFHVIFYFLNANHLNQRQCARSLGRWSLVTGTTLTMGFCLGMRT